MTTDRMLIATGPPSRGAPPTRGRWQWVRTAIGAVLLVAVVGFVGTDAALAGVRAIDVRVLIAGIAIVALSTACAAWRWTVITRGVGLRLSYGDALLAYYRSQLLNATLPAGVLGDVERAVRLARDQGDAAGASATVVVERVIGQSVQLMVAALVVAVWGADSGLPQSIVVTLVAGSVAFAAVALVIGGATLARRNQRFPARAAVAVTFASAIAAAGYAALFLLAARVAGVEHLEQIIPLAFVVIVGSAIPVSLAGWGPREGVAAWVFASAGLGAELGLSVSVTYGVLSLVAAAPGVVPLLWSRRR